MTLFEDLLCEDGTLSERPRAELQGKRKPAPSSRLGQGPLGPEAPAAGVGSGAGAGELLACRK